MIPQRILKTKVLVKVIQPPLSVTLSKVVTIGRKLQGVFFTSKGLSRIEFKIDKCQYRPGDVIHLNALFDNRESDKPITSIKIKLMKCIKGLDPSRGRKIRRHNILYRKIITSTIQKGMLVETCFDIPLNPKKFINNQLEKIINILTDKNEEFKGEVI